MRPAENIEKLIKHTKIDTNAKVDELVLDDVIKAFEKAKSKKSATYQPDIWRIIMKSKITKLAAAAVIIIAVIVWSGMPGTLLSTAYALQDTIEAYNPIRYLHISEFETIGQEQRPSQLWVACDYYGRLDKIRWEAPNPAGPELGAVALVSDGSISEVWFKNQNLCFKTIGNGEALIRWEISELDPKLVFERLYEQEKQGGIILDVNEPEDKSKPIVITVTYPEGSLSEAYKKVFYVDQSTKLVRKIEKFKMRDGKYHHVRTAEFSGYNDEIDPMMFSLDGELPEDTVYLDRSHEEIGLAQGNMTDEQVAVEVGRKFFEAIRDKDLDKAGLMWSGVPGSIIEKMFMGANVVKIISVGQSRPDPDPDSTSMIGSCKALLEFDGESYELEADKIFVRRVSTQPDRWTICGLAADVKPAE